MFTGIIKKISKVKKIGTGPKGYPQSIFVDVVLPRDWKLKKGDSISINGICSTIYKLSKNIFGVEYMPETINKTTVSGWSDGSVVNLERSLKFNDLVDGHLVSGHIDGVGKITKIEEMGDSKIFTIKTSVELMKYIAPKGSVSLDGISLTVVDVFNDSFTVSLVSYTLLNTNLENEKAGNKINIETDLIAKYIYNILKNEEKRK